MSDRSHRMHSEQATSQPSPEDVGRCPLPVSLGPVRLEDLTHDFCGHLVEAGCPVGGLLDERLRFERLLLDISADFVNPPLHEIGERIENGLRRLGAFLNIDRSSFAEFTDGQRDMLVTHYYVAPGIAPFPAVIVDGQLPWYSEQIRQGRTLRFARLPDDVPPEASAERAFCIQQGLKSNLSIPLRSGGEIRCVITFASFHDHREWPDEVVRRLQLIGEIFAQALARRKAEERSHQLREQLSRVGRITSVGELVATIAHEINQPLCAILNNAQACQRMLASAQLDDADAGEVRETLADIAGDSRRIHEIVVRVRGMLQSHELQRESLSVNEAICEVMTMIRGKLSAEAVSLKLALGHELPPVYFDRVQLQQVVLNLALNAIDAMCHAAGNSRWLQIGAVLDDSSLVHVTVQDSGPGVPRDQLERIFDPFFSTKPDGLGIGLAISRSIVELHGGRIWATSREGGGAAFHFTLPVVGASS